MINLQAQMKELFGNSCYCYCLCRKFLETDDIKTLTKYVLGAWYMNYVESSGYVSKPLDFVKSLCGKQYKDVKKVPIKQKADIPTEPTIVEMACPTGGSHFVIAQRNSYTNEIELVFDPAGISNSWKAQHFVSYRRFV